MPFRVDPVPRAGTSRSPVPAPTERLRVLILADSCNPDWVSLPAVAYQTCRAIAELADVVLVTSVRNESAFAAHGCGRARVVYLDHEALAAPLYRLGKLLRGGEDVAWSTNMALLYPAYLGFERRAWRRFGRELRAGAFDLVHRLTPMSPTIPSPMASWSPVPFVIGPLNGGLPWPAAFRREQRREREHLRLLRGLCRTLPYHRSTFARSRVVLAAFQHTLDDLPRCARGAALHFPEVGVDPGRFRPPPARRSMDGTLTFLFAGRLVPYKCCDVLLAAFARSSALRRHRLIVAGDGPERPALERDAARLGLGASVEFAGWKSQAEIAELMRSSDVFAFPSIRELGAGVVIEAMATGCVPVVVEYGGPAGLVDERCGLRVPLGPKAVLAAGFARALEDLAADRARLRRLSEAGVERARSAYGWDAKAAKMLEVYRWALGLRATPPSFDGAQGSRPS